MGRAPDPTSEPCKSLSRYKNHSLQVLSADSTVCWASRHCCHFLKYWFPEDRKHVSRLISSAHRGRGTRGSRGSTVVGAGISGARTPGAGQPLQLGHAGRHARLLWVCHARVTWGGEACRGGVGSRTPVWEALGTAPDPQPRTGELPRPVHGTRGKLPSPSEPRVPCLWVEFLEDGNRAS